MMVYKATATTNVETRTAAEAAFCDMDATSQSAGVSTLSGYVANL